MSRRLARPLLEDMRSFAREAEAFLGNRTGEALAADRMRFLAVSRAVEIVGEAAARVPEVVQDQLLGIDFAGAISMRHRLAHGYGAINPTILADTVRTDFPQMIGALDSALAGTLADETG